MEQSKANVAQPAIQSATRIMRSNCAQEPSKFAPGCLLLDCRLGCQCYAAALLGCFANATVGGRCFPTIPTCTCVMLQRLLRCVQVVAAFATLPCNTMFLRPLRRLRRGRTAGTAGLCWAMEFSSPPQTFQDAGS
eukprot:4457894-Alexandrium_andersonii.AAC.2